MAALPTYAASAGPTTIADIYARSQTSESYILAGGITRADHLAAVMSRPSKGTRLIAAIISGVRDNAYPYSQSREHRTSLLTTLLAEPALTYDQLHTICEIAVRDLLSDPDLLAAVCARPGHPHTFVHALWGISTEGARTIAEAGYARGSEEAMLAAAINWVRRDADRRRSGYRGWAVTSGDRQQIDETLERWTWATRGNPALAAFVTTSSFAFTDEDDLFAVGRAICAQPPRSGRPRA